jgi:erythromycin esterase
VDVVVEVLDSRDSVLQSIDSPNGRNGPEPVEIFAPRRSRYRIRVRPYDDREPEGPYTLAVSGWRDARATTALLATRTLARDSASAWLRAHSARLDSSLAPFEALARRVKVIGLGEATHGSREFGDMRLRLTRHLVERLGYRIIAIENSASRLALLNRYTRGQGGQGGQVDSVTRMIECGWIGRRVLRELVAWLRQWNAAHPADVVELVGLDPQDGELARRDLRLLITRAYPEVLDRFGAVEREIAAADSQTWVFGNSNVDSSARHFLQELSARLNADLPLLRRLFDSSLVASGARAAREFFQFADFNASDAGWQRSRDWHMTSNLLDEMDRRPGAKAVYWAHNAHVAAPPDRSPGSRPMGAWLRETLGCDYGAVALAFDAGGFVAQIPNDLEDDLAVSTLPVAPDETIEGVLRTVRPGATIATWRCEDRAAAPSWLLQPQRMHWVGGLYRPGTNPSESFRPFRLTYDLDGVVFFPRVSADEVPTDRPRIPARAPR